MTNPSTRVRGAGAPARRTLAAAARAAAKRTERPRRTASGGGASADAPPPEPLSGRTVVIEPADGWDDPPEPSSGSDAESPDDRREESVRGGRKESLEAGAADTADAADVREAGDPDPSEASEASGNPDGSAGSRPERAGRSRRGLYAALLALLLVAGLVAVAVLGLRYRDAGRADAARDEALAAARKAAPVVLSYDHRHLDRDFARALSHLTGDFREEYRRTTKTVVAPTAKKYKGTVQATVVEPPGGGAPAASVVSAAPDRVVVLLFVNQVTESTQVTGPRLDLNRVRMTLSRTSQGWKVSAVDAL